MNRIQRSIEWRHLRLLLLLCLPLFGYDRCGIIDPPADPQVIQIDASDRCLRQGWSRISSNSWLNGFTQQILRDRDYQRIPDLRITLGAGQCFVLPDCLGADETGVGLGFRSEGFDFINPDGVFYNQLGVSRFDTFLGAFRYLMTPRNSMQAALSEIDSLDTARFPQILMCAQDDALVTATDPDSPWRGWAAVGQTDEDKVENGDFDPGMGLVRWEITIVPAPPVVRVEPVPYPGITRNEVITVRATVDDLLPNALKVHCAWSGHTRPANFLLNQTEFDPSNLEFGTTPGSTVDSALGFEAVPQSDGTYLCEAEVKFSETPDWESGPSGPFREEIPFLVTARQTLASGVSAPAQDEGAIPVQGTEVSNLDIDLILWTTVRGPNERFSIRAQAFNAMDGVPVDAHFIWVFDEPNVLSALIDPEGVCVFSTFTGKLPQERAYPLRCLGSSRTFSDAHLRSRTDLLGPGSYDFTVFAKHPTANTQYQSVSGVLVVESAAVGGGYCGDGQTSPEEDCDDGNVIDVDACTNLCILNTMGGFCGDGQTSPEEECDDGDNDDGDGCSASCLLEVCGNGRVEPIEECDDGNTSLEACLYGDTGCLVCNGSCDFEAGATSFCGDSFTDNLNGENCDDGNAQAEVCAYGEMSCAVCGSGCTTVAGATSFCGDGMTDPANAEECDDANLVDDDGCRNTCLLPLCGDGVLQLGEECDDGNNADGDGCSAICQSEGFCGDGVIDPEEECDDGGNAICDDCSDTCRFEFCGDGIHCASQGEECDDGNLIDGDGCRIACTLPVCGDGVIDLGEDCDDGNLSNGDGCSATCQGEVPFTAVHLVVNPFLGSGFALFPRFDDAMEIEIVMGTSSNMSALQVEVVGCSEPAVSDCTPVVESNLDTSQWSLRLPRLTGAVGGQIYDLRVTATAPTGQTVEFILPITVYPADPAFAITCTKRIDPVNGFEVDFDVFENGQPIAGHFEQRLWLYEDKDDGEGWVLDETDALRSGFVLSFPNTFSPGADGDYQVVYSATPDLVTGLQATLYFTDDGGPDDVCVWE